MTFIRTFILAKLISQSIDLGVNPLLRFRPTNDQSFELPFFQFLSSISIFCLSDSSFPAISLWEANYPPLLFPKIGYVLRFSRPPAPFANFKNRPLNCTVRNPLDSHCRFPPPDARKLRLPPLRVYIGLYLAFPKLSICIRRFSFSRLSDIQNPTRNRHECAKLQFPDSVISKMINQFSLCARSWN